MAEKIESISGELSLRQGFVDYKKHLGQAYRKSDKYNWPCFCRCIGKLAGLMQELHDKYQEMKQTPEGANLQLRRLTGAELQMVKVAGTASRMHMNDTIIMIAGYCLGKGCGFESTRVLQSSASNSDSMQCNWGYGRHYYESLTRHFNIIISVFSTRNFLEGGKAISAGGHKRVPHWALAISNDIRIELNLDMPTKCFVLDQWTRRQPWISKRIFGEDSERNGQRSQMDQLRAF